MTRILGSALATVGDSSTMRSVLLLGLVSSMLGCAFGGTSADSDMGECFCESPPADHCVDPMTLRRYDGAGFCLDGECEYTFDDEACPNGCAYAVCRDDACAGVSCDSAPASECIDASTLRIFDVGASCRNGACEYESRELSCAAGCAAGACLPQECGASVCDSPPSQCHESAGSCMDGECMYEAKPASASCDDSDACTIDDRCGSGVCAGTAIVCDAPPAPTCVDASTLRSYGSTGTCTAATCTYASTDTHCPEGCEHGACASSGCASVTCDTPPQATCVDASTLRTYASVGTCTAGTCSHAPTDTHCPEGCSGGACASTCTPVPWTTTAIETSSGFTGLDPSLAVDASGGVHVAYTDYTEGALRYAHRSTSGSWSSVTLSSSGTDQRPSLALDASGGVHISYYDELRESLEYAYRSPIGSFTVTTVEVVSWTSAIRSALALDASGGLHILYAEDASWTLRHAHRPSATAPWAITTIPSISDGQLNHPSLTVDPSGGLHAAYVSWNYDAFYAHRGTDGEWTEERFATGPGRQGTSLGLDALGRVHVSYWETTSPRLQYARREASGEWTTGTALAADATMSTSTSLALDGAGNVHVSYYDHDGDAGRRLRHARRNATGTWTHTTVDAFDSWEESIVFWPHAPRSSIVVDASGATHIAYSAPDTTSRTVLRYAYTRECP